MGFLKSNIFNTNKLKVTINNVVFVSTTSPSDTDNKNVYKGKEEVYRELWESSMRAFTNYLKGGNRQKSKTVRDTLFSTFPGN